MCVKCWPSTPRFCVMSADEQPSYRAILDKVLLRVCKISVSPKVFLEYEKRLQKTTAKYPYMKANMTTQTIEAYQTSLTIDNIFQNIIPAKICIGLLDTSGYNCGYYDNPFEFQSRMLSYMAFYIDGISFPSTPFEPIYSQTGVDSNCVREYLSLFNVASKAGEDSGNYISHND